MTQAKKHEKLAPFGDGPAHQIRAFSTGAYDSIEAWMKDLKLSGADHLKRPWEDSAFIYAAVAKRCDAVAEVPFVLRDGPTKEAETIDDHPMLDLLRRPNAHMDDADLRYFTQGYRDLCGECFWLFAKKDPNDEGKFRPISKGEAPDMIWPAGGHQLTIHMRAGSMAIDRVAFTATGGESPLFERHSFGLLRNPHLYEWWRGFGPVEALSRQAEQMFQIERFDDALVRNGGSPGLILSTEQTLNPEQAREAQELVEERIKGPTNATRPMVVGKGLSVVPYGWSPKDMEHSGLRTWNRDAMMAVLGVTKPVLSITDDVNLANAESAVEVFWRFTMTAQLSQLRRQVQREVVERIPLAGRARGSELWLAFDTSGIDALQESIDNKIERTCTLMEKAGATFTTAARLAGWDVDPDLAFEIEEANEAKRAMAAAIAVQTTPDDAEDDEPEDEGADDAPVTAAQRTALVETIALRLQGKLAPSGQALRLFGLSQEAADAVEARLAGLPHVRDAIEAAEAASVLLAEAVTRRASTPEARRARATDHDTWLRAWEAKIGKGFAAPARDYVLAGRKALREFAKRERSGKPEKARAFEAPAFLALLESLLPGIESFAERFGVTMGGVSEAMVAESIAIAASDLGLATPNIEASGLRMAALIESKRVRLASGVFTTLETTIKDTLTRAFLGGLDAVGEGDLADAILGRMEELEGAFGEILDDDLPMRAQRIARTEAGMIANSARVAEFEAGGIERHEWVAANDAATRGTHAELDGRIVELGASFRDDITLRYPLDPNGPAAEIINCRCTTLPVFED